MGGRGSKEKGRTTESDAVENTTENEQETSIYDLPVELVDLVVRMLPAVGVVMLSRTSKLFHSLLEDELLWREKYLHTFGTLPAEEVVEIERSHLESIGRGGECVYRHLLGRRLRREQSSVVRRWYQWGRANTVLESWLREEGNGETQKSELLEAARQFAAAGDRSKARECVLALRRHGIETGATTCIAHGNALWMLCTFANAESDTSLVVYEEAAVWWRHWLERFRATVSVPSGGWDELERVSEKETEQWKELVERGRDLFQAWGDLCASHHRDDAAVDAYTCAVEWQNYLLQLCDERGRTATGGATIHYIAACACARQSRYQQAGALFEHVAMSNAANRFSYNAPRYLLLAALAWLCHHGLLEESRAHFRWYHQQDARFMESHEWMVLCEMMELIEHQDATQFDTFVQMTMQHDLQHDMDWVGLPMMEEIKRLFFPAHPYLCVEARSRSRSQDSTSSVTSSDYD